MMNSNYINYLKSSKSEKTIETYIGYVEKFLNYVKKQDTDITYMDIVNYQSSLSNLSGNSVRLHLASIKSYFNFLEKMGIIQDNPTRNIEAPKVNPKPKHYMDETDISQMLKHARTVRDEAIVKFMVSTGVRISEMINITLEQYQNTINNNDDSILIKGKGSKERFIYLNKDTINTIDKYLIKRGSDDCPYLFVSFRHTQIDPESMSKTLKTMARNAGIPFWKDISNHALRSASATIMNKNGASLSTIQHALGHADITTTGLYIKNSDNDIRNAMNNMNF